MLPDINELSSSTTPAPSVQPQIAIGKDLFYINSNKHNLNNCFYLASVPPPVDIPVIIPFTPVAPSDHSPAPPPPPPAPPLPAPVQSLLIPPPPADESQIPADESQVTADESQVPADEQAVVAGDGGNSLLSDILNFHRTTRLQSATRRTPATKPDPFDKASLPSSQEGSFMNNLRILLKQRRPFITGENSSSSAADDNSD